jgi:hypothetical protein
MPGVSQSNNARCVLSYVRMDSCFQTMLRWLACIRTQVGTQFPTRSTPSAPARSLARSVMFGPEVVRMRCVMMRCRRPAVQAARLAGIDGFAEVPGLVPSDVLQNSFAGAIRSHDRLAIAQVGKRIQLEACGLMWIRCHRRHPLLLSRPDSAEPR